MSEIAQSSPPAERHLPLVIALLSIVVLWGLYFIWYQQMRTDYRSSQEDFLIGQRHAVAEHVNGIFRITELFLATASEWIEDHPDRDPRTDPEFASLVKNFQRINNESMLVRLVATDGTLHLVPPVAQAKAANVADRDYFVAAMASDPGRLAISAPFQGRSTGRWAVSVATRVAKPSHGISVVFVALELALFDDVFRKLRVGEDSSISLVRRDGILMARSATNPGQLGTDMTKSVLFTQGLPERKEGVLFTDARLTDNVPKLLAFAALEKYPLVVTVGRSVADIRRQTQGTLAIVGVVLLLVSVLILSVARNVARRIRDERRLRDTLKLTEEFRMALDRVPAFVYMKDRSSRYTYANQPTLTLFGCTRDDLPGSEDSRFFPPDAVARLHEVDRRVLAGEDTQEEIEVRYETGHRFYHEAKTPVYADAARTVITGLCGISTDITALKDVQSRLEQLAHYDALTGLPNRALLADRMGQALALTQRRQTVLAVFFLDLDGFKAVNDSHGHETGDKLLVALAARMKEALRDGDTLSRLGGDEFVAVLLDLQSQSDSLPVLERLLAAAAEPVVIGDLSLQVSASIGVTYFPQAQAVDPDHLMRQADQAMYQAKKAGKNRYCVFEG